MINKIKKLTSMIWAYTFLPAIALSQSNQTDSIINNIQPVDIKVYFRAQPLLTTTTSAKVITQQQIQSQGSATLLPALNTTPGVRMEERSPGSYRLAMRGSLLRSPFGVRNIKIYLDEIPMTDAGGNTYLNLLDPVGIQQIQVIKGPDGSIYGPNTGGAITITPNGMDRASNQSMFNINAGSYGAIHQQLSTNYQVNKKYQFSFDQSYLRSDGYRDHTAMDRKFFQTAQQFAYHEKASIKALLMYVEMGYQTPGGLTATQYEMDPKQSRPAAGANPSAKDQKAGIYNNTVLGGITHTLYLNPQFAHYFTLFGSYTDFENPFITNYEFRKEKNAGIRTYLSYQNKAIQDWNIHMQLGLEAQKGWYNINNYDNNKGIYGNIQAKDKLQNGTHFYFYRGQFIFKNKLTLEGSLGVNYNNVAFTRSEPIVVNPTGEVSFATQWMPRMAASYAFTPNQAVRASYSKGFSTPTISEIRSSDNSLNTQLNPEYGNNYEIGYRVESKNRRLIADLSGYTYKLQNGIIRQLNDAGAEFFQNAGIIEQRGIEMMVFANIFSNEAYLFKFLNLSSSLTHQDYVFKNYQVANNDYSGNFVTSVPRWMLNNTVHTNLANKLELHIQHTYTSKIPLNDANTNFASKYNLIQAKLSWNKTLRTKYKVQFYAGVDNLLEEKYSLGNDINAFGGRFYNVSMPRNYYAGIKIRR